MCWHRKKGGGLWEEKAAPEERRETGAELRVTPYCPSALSRAELRVTPYCLSALSRAERWTGNCFNQRPLRHYHEAIDPDDLG